MARRRRPPVEGPPAELLCFRGDDWIGDDGVPPLERWHKARFAVDGFRPSRLCSAVRLKGFCPDEFPASCFECLTETAGCIRKGSMVRQPVAPKEG